MRSSLQIKHQMCVRVLAFESEFDGFNQHYQFAIDCVWEHKLMRENWYQCYGQLCWQVMDGSRYYSGVISAAAYYGHDAHGHRYRFTLVSPLYWLDRKKQTRCFLHRSLQQILRQILHEKPQIQCKFPSFQPEIMIDYLLQYNEKTLSFIQRILPRHVRHYYFHQHRTHTEVVFANEFLQSECVTLNYQSELTLCASSASVFYVQQKLCLFPKNEFIIGKSNCVKLMVGSLLKLQNHPLEFCNGIYRIHAIKHTFNGNYHNELRLFSLDAKVYSEPRSLSSSCLYTATVIEYNEAENHYRIMIDALGIESLGAVHCVQEGIGFRFPLNTKVIVAFFHDNMQRSIILGAQPNSKQKPLITSVNPQQHRLCNNAGQEICLDDSIGINFVTKAEQSCIKLISLAEEPTFFLQSENADITLQVSGHTKQTIGRDYVSRALIQNFQVSQHWRSVCKHGGVQIRTDQNFELQSKASIYWQAEKNINMKISDTLAIKTSEEITYNCIAGNQVWQLDNVTLEGQKLNLYSAGGKINLGANLANLVMNSAGIMFAVPTMLVAPVINK